jgi:hypothetical protein
MHPEHAISSETFSQTKNAHMSKLYERNVKTTDFEDVASHGRLDAIRPRF